MIDAQFSKQEIAERQLMRALKLFFEEKDYISVITLAGASEGILGPLAKADGKQSAYGSRKKAFEHVYGQFYGKPPEDKEFNELVNGVRNGLKHFTCGKPMIFDPEQEAINILDSAVKNYILLTGIENEEIMKFRNYHKSLRITF